MSETEHACLACEATMTRQQFEESDFCEGCDGHNDVVYCALCDEHTANEPECRHLEWLPDAGLWGGCGSSETSPDFPSERTGLFAMLDAAPEMAGALRRAMRKIRLLDVFEHGPILGTATLDLIVGKRDFGDRFWPDSDRRCLPGIYWLSSLLGGGTGRARRLTVRWIDQWRRGRQRQKAKSGCPEVSPTGESD